MAMPREFYIRKNAKEIKDVNTDAVAYVEDLEGGKFTAMVFAGKRSKYDKYYGFKTAERRDEYVKEYFEDIAASYESKKKYAEKKKAMAAENQENYKVGDILYSAWGYDQTNVDFYQIVKKTKSQKKPRQGNGRNTKTGNKGGGPRGSTTSKFYKKKYRGQGKRR